MIVDLHSHSNCSDGQLTPEQLLSEASKAGIELFSITDHDTLAAYRQIGTAIPEKLTLLPGIELSCTWRKMTIHLVGLNVEPESQVMADAEQAQGLARAERFEKIIHRLKKIGLSIDNDQLIANAGQCPGRPHIAKYLLETGQVNSERHAFDKYLGQGKTGDVKECWPNMDKAIRWITESGGVAVLAHPLKYGLTRTKLMELALEFRESGGKAIEVVSGQQNPNQTALLRTVATRFDLLGSVGSDFHRPDQPWARLGRVAPLPNGIAPVWSLFS